MAMVEFLKMGDKQGQQRRRRADGAVRSVADRSAVEENRALAPQAAQTTQGRSSMDPEPSCAGRDFVDSAERGSLAGPTGEIPTSFDVLAAAARLGGAGRLVENLACISERVEPAPATEVERIVSGREFCAREKRGCGVGKPSGARGRSGWWWSTAAVFLWETTFTLHPRRKSNSRKRRSRRSAQGGVIARA